MKGFVDLASIYMYKCMDAPTMVPREGKSELRDQAGEGLSQAMHARVARFGQAILEVLYGCGLRVSECTGLDLGDAILEEGYLHILGKGNKERIAPISGAALRALRLAWDKIAPQGWPLFCAEWGFRWGRLATIDLETELQEQRDRTLRELPLAGFKPVQQIQSAKMEQGVLAIATLPDGNDIVLAFRNPSFAPRWRELGNTAKALRARTGLDFPKFMQRLERSRRLRYL